MPYGISDLTLCAIQNVIRQHKGVTRTILYGSRAKGTYQNGSDIDITLEGEELSFDDLLKIESQLDALDLPYHFDVSLYNELSHPDLLQHIQRVGCEIYNQNWR
jgi:predicted nucleotidyltransferase